MFKFNDAYGRNYPNFFDTSVPVMSQRLVEQLRASGVANIDTYPVVLHDTRNQHQRTDYVAVNVVGCVNAVDFEKTAHEIRRGKPKLNGAIAIDARLTNSLLAFRMPYSPRFIVVAAPIAKALAKLSLDSVLLQPTTLYRGV